MSQLNIENNRLVLSNVVLGETVGSMNHTGTITVSGAITSATVTADTIYAKNVVAENGLTNWVTTTDEQLNGLGFNWAWGEHTTRLAYATGGILWTNANFNLNGDNTYNIQGVPVITSNSLGPQISKSNLTQVGNLNSLRVLGDTEIGEFVFFNSNTTQLGINTEETQLALTIQEDGIILKLGSQQTNFAYIGTHSHHDLQIGTDSTSRLIVKTTGEITVGDPVSRSAQFTVYGNIVADSITTDNRVDRYHSLELLPDTNGTVYGKGIEWNGTGPTKSLLLQDSPSRIVSTESFEVAKDRGYYIDSSIVLTSTSLGASVTSSNLTSVGILQTLTVSGQTTLNNDLVIASGILQTNTISVGDLTLINSAITTKNQFSISVSQASAVYADQTRISLGNKENTVRTINLYGRVGVNVTTPDPSLALAVNGDVSFSGRKFTSGVNVPTSGTFGIGDICWNNAPGSGSYIGWVCVSAGVPGQWAPFGMIASQ
jgi:hypothetical protein